jgi:hypothetical protein
LRPGAGPEGRSRGRALAGRLLTANWLLRGLAGMNANLQLVFKWTPMYFNQGGRAVDGLNWGWLGGLLGVALLLAVLAMLLFRRRDVRVGGERSWTLPRWGRSRARVKP